MVRLASQACKAAIKASRRAISCSALMNKACMPDQWAKKGPSVPVDLRVSIMRSPCMAFPDIFTICMATFSEASPKALRSRWKSRALPRARETTIRVRGMLYCSINSSNSRIRARLVMTWETPWVRVNTSWSARATRLLIMPA